MKAAFDELGLTSESYELGSATGFTNFAIRGDPWAREAWLKHSAGTTGWDGRTAGVELIRGVRTQQEWCHLFGHGDGGDEEIANFVSGSKHCNTEQLAIETGQRYGRFPKLTARVTAYLWRSEGHKKKDLTDEDRSVLKRLRAQSNESFLKQIGRYIMAWEKGLTSQSGSDEAKAALAELTAALEALLPDRSTDETPSIDKVASWDAKSKRKYCRHLYTMLKAIPVLRYPVADMIRYKIYHNNVKIFDHLFDGQSESFDYNEFKILDHTVRVAVANATGTGQSLAEHINWKVGAWLADHAEYANKLTEYRVPKPK
jgi:hypothetical protein